jgi:hypothetical protein
MSLWMIAAAIAAAALGGIVIGALLAIRFSRWREKAWLRNRCAGASKMLQAWFGNPLVLDRMTRRIATGHDFTTDKQWRSQLREILERAFRVGRTTA